MAASLDIGDKIVFEADGLEALIAAVSQRGYRVMGPTMRDGAIVDLHSTLATRRAP